MFDATVGCFGTNRGVIVPNQHPRCASSIIDTKMDVVLVHVVGIIELFKKQCRIE